MTAARWPEPSLRIAEDKLAVLLNWDLPAGESFDSGALAEALFVKLGQLELASLPEVAELQVRLDEALERGRRIKDAILLEGRPATSPRDGRATWAGDFFNTGFAVDPATGKVDYRQRAAESNVKAGQLLARRIPLKRGEHGVDVFGHPIPAREPRRFYPDLGRNVRYDADEGAYYARVTGRIRLVNGTLHVDDVYTIEGSVDIETGNISHPGALVIEQDVLEGATIEAEGDIEVKGTVEAAHIRTQGSLTVHGGITRSEGRGIEVKGAVRAKFILTSEIDAGGDIVVEREILNSTVATNGAIVMPKGRLVGGECFALRGIYLGQVNTPAGVPTELTVGQLQPKSAARLRKKEQQIETLERELKALGKETPSPAQADKQKIMQELLARLNQEAERTRSALRDRARLEIRVRRAIYQGTTVRVGYDKLLIEEDRTGPLTITLKEGKIRIA